jgi:hypothetical protein
VTHSAPLTTVVVSLLILSRSGTTKPLMTVVCESVVMKKGKAEMMSARRRVRKAKGE